jgi:WXG100 family type VII secretion target
MADLIKVPYSELFQRASVIRSKADLVRGEIKKLDGTVANIQWMGQRAQKFFDMWAQAKPDMEAWATILDNFANDLETQARKMQAADERF